MLEARMLSCVRDGTQLFHSLSFQIQAGEIIQVTGQNGAGKTSLLRILSGLAHPDDGEVLWHGVPVRQQREQWHSDLLWLSHQTGIKKQLTADENLHFYSPATPIVGRQLAFDEVDLVGFEETQTAQLSAGQQRRVALSRLWLTNAPLWLLDEPFTALDAKGVEKLTQCIELHVAQGGMVIFTTHSPLRNLKVPVRLLELTGSEGSSL
ncbi:TPA: cytochrome c biogenesis heme-transporting ATPase CcmA [Enterobacter hormaechei subsp. steigerwaltii]|nr:cytochrome c biogenesis heme-transporting ATPase CcmA [Enterobacter hormaechei subsp. steigerwaltii]